MLARGITGRTGWGDSLDHLGHPTRGWYMIWYFKAISDRSMLCTPKHFRTTRIHVHTDHFKIDAETPDSMLFVELLIAGIIMLGDQDLDEEHRIGGFGIDSNLVHLGEVEQLTFFRTGFSSVLIRSNRGSDKARKWQSVRRREQFV